VHLISRKKGWPYLFCASVNDAYIRVSYADLVDLVSCFFAMEKCSRSVRVQPAPFLCLSSFALFFVVQVLVAHLVFLFL
jgi:hypothetical protein